ncbi:MAG: anti-sigma factor family protein [Planctomycetota bacterium]|jgi:hypothetical protein
MKCDKFENEIVLQLYGELDFAGAESLEKHLEECAACRTLLEDYRGIRKMTQDLEVKDFSEETLAGIRRTVNVELSTARSGRKSVLSLVLRYAAAAVILIILILIARSPRDSFDGQKTAFSNTATTNLTITDAGTAAATPDLEAINARKSRILAKLKSRVKPKYAFPEAVKSEKKFQQIDGGVTLARAYVGNRSGTGYDDRLTRIEGRLASKRQELKTILGEEKNSGP